MPPRRSSRSTRSSVEPPSTTSATSAKRKRVQAIVDVHEVEEQENIVIPAKNAIRSGAGSGTSTRRKPLMQVSETDEAEEVDSPPPKKHRPSPSPELEYTDIEDSEEEAVLKKPTGRGRNANATKPSSVARSAKGRSAAKIVDVSSDDEDQAPQSTSKGSKPRSQSRNAVTAGRKSRAPSSTRTGRSSKRIKVEDNENRIAPQIVEVDEEEEDSGEHTVQEIKGRKGVSRGSTSAKQVDTRMSSSTASAIPSGSAHGKESGSQPPDMRKGKKPVSRGSRKIVQDGNEAEPRHEGNDGQADSEVQAIEEDGVNGEDSIDAQLSDDGEQPQSPRPVEADTEEQSLLDPPEPALHQQMPSTQETKEQEEPQGPKTRLVIHKMVLVNFKSYAGRQEIGPFHKSFSAIVGPNGSGKSNTIDALLFVFGWRATKMRQGKLSELIHNSARHPDLDECSVEVHFREIVDLPGPDAYEVAPDSKLVVARTAYKSNNSKYAINGESSSFTEVRNLLKDKGIDLDHKRFLILQGEVESIAQMKPKAPSEHEDGLLEYLEDIIGTAQYKEPIDEALIEMERLSEDRQEKLNRLRIVEKEKMALEEKKKEAEDYLRMQNEHVRALSRLYQWYLWKCLLNEDEYSRNIVQTEQELEHEREQNQDDVTHLEMLTKHYQEREKAYAEVKTAAEEAAKDLSVHEKQGVSLEEKRKHSSGKAKKLKKALQDDERAAAEALHTIEESTRKIAKEKTKVDEFEASLVEEEKALEEIRDSLKDKTQVFHDQIEAKQKELQPWMAQINAKHAEIDVASSERDTLTKKAQAIKEAVQEAQEALQQLQADHGTKTAELGELTANRSQIQQEFRADGRKLQDIQARVQELRASASSSRQKTDEAKASQAANTSQNRVLDSLTRLKQSGRIDGFHGRLGSLGTIPDKYDVAISTACTTLNNLVVDSVDQGQTCIEYLRKQNIGRASFIVLDKLSDNGLDKIQTPENIPRLFDLVKPKDPRFASAFFKAIGNTLVADNLEQANRIAFGGQRRWRVVTLAGQLIESSGAMSGGGTHVSRGIMSSKLAADTVSHDVLRTYEKESEDASRRLEEALQELHKIEANVEALSKSGPQMDMAIEKINLDIQTGSRRISETQKRIRELKSQNKPDAGDLARISALDEEIAMATEELEGLQEKSGAIEQAIKDLEKKILDVGGARLLTQKSKVDGIKLHINIANDEITKAEVAKAKAEKDSIKFKGTVESNAASLQEAEDELQELVEQLADCTQYVAELRGKMEAAQAAADNSKDDLENLKSELDAKNEEIRGFREKEMTLQQKLDQLKKDADVNDRALDHWRTEHDQLTLEEIDDDDEDDEEDGGDESGQPPEGHVKPEPGEDKLDGKVRHHDALELHIYSEAELMKFKKQELVADSELLDEKLKNAKPNLAALKEYKKREEEFLKRAHDLERITTLRDEQKLNYDSLRKQRLDEFMAGFTAISLKLKEMYQMITLGGNAELELVDNMDPFSEGVIFSVMPPKKSWKNISHLSGGEKTLSSLALVFALHHFKPTPLYFMDEIDAALDFRNVSIVANYIKDRTKNAQFIIISLRNDMFELSHRLIGIYKTANQTRSLSIDNRALTAIPVTSVPLSVASAAAY